MRNAKGMVVLAMEDHGGNNHGVLVLGGHNLLGLTHLHLPYCVGHVFRVPCSYGGHNFSIAFLLPGLFIVSDDAFTESSLAPL